MFNMNSDASKRECPWSRLQTTPLSWGSTNRYRFPARMPARSYACEDTLLEPETMPDELHMPAESV